MKNQKTKGLLFIIGGIILAPVSYWGHDLGIAIDAELGAAQWAGIVIGIVLVVYGLWMFLKNR
ncbi:MAG: hypothetical protein U5L09_12900 [Bacteroidales bacterium]|nr:hypothetical protein [Bacteroidales bacterium]